MSWIKEVFGA